MLEHNGHLQESYEITFFNKIFYLKTFWHIFCFFTCLFAYRSKRFSSSFAYFSTYIELFSLANLSFIPGI